MKDPREKAEKTLIAEVSRLIVLFNCSKKWGPVAIHMVSISFTSTSEAINLIQKQRICQIHKQENGMVETRQATRTYLAV